MNESVRESVKKPDSAKEDRTSRARTSEYSQPVNSSVGLILFLQRTIGNQAVSRLMKSGTLHAKLRIGQPGDEYEQEADKVAEQVMRMPEMISRNELHIQRSCPACDKNELKRQPIKEEEDEEKKLRRQPKEEEEEEKLQATTTSDRIPEIDSNIEFHIHSLNGRGQPLSEDSRAFFEPRFGYDFSDVRVHTDANAGESARAVNAKAFTVGKDVVFGEGEYMPDTKAGRMLVAHELAHVVQQRNKTVNSENKLQFVSPAGLCQQNAIQEKVSHTMNQDMLLQRVHIEDGRIKFDCAFYADDPKLEDCLNDKDRLRPFDTGDSVIRVQTGLKAAGEYMGEISGIYDAATGQAVMAFKKNQELGSEKFPDVGPGTTSCLDKLCLSNGQCQDKTPPPVIPEKVPPLSDELIVQIANSERINALFKAGHELMKLHEQATSGIFIPITPVVWAVNRWLYTFPGKADYADTIDKAISLIDQNISTNTNIRIDRSPECKDHAFVGALGDPGKGITVCDLFFKKHPNCQREVITHEYFHLINLIHHYDATTTKEALECPHHMAELVFDIAKGQTGGCAQKPIDCISPIP